MVDKKKLISFILIVVIAFAAIGATTPWLMDNVKLGLDLKGGFEILYTAKPVEKGGKVTKDTLRETARSLEKRADAYGVTEPEVTPEGKNRIRAKIAGVTNQEQVRTILKKPAELTFRGPDGKNEMVGSDFKAGGAKVQYDSHTNQPIITIKVKDAAKFKDVTTRLLGQPLAIYLDDKEISAPQVNSIITDGNATISGNYTSKGAKELADIINLGALPLTLTEKYTQSVGATLGQDSLDKTMEAVVIAFVLILLFMLAFYRVPGIVACATLIFYSWLLLLLFNLFNVTLTLPGIAAFVLGIGMAVDANIITYERIKEELRTGKSILSSLKSGSKHSFRTIIDANVTHIIAGGVLFYFGSGTVQGFALIMIISTLTSIFTNVFISRLLLTLLVRSNVAKKPAYFGVKEAEISAL